jgi:microcin C transport system permease protein
MEIGQFILLSNTVMRRSITLRLHLTLRRHLGRTALGTDDRGRDVLSRLIYGFRLSILFGLALTIVGVTVGVITGSLMGFFGGKFDLISQRLIEIWSAMPELYLLIIFASIFHPSVLLLILLLAAFGWMGLSDYVRAEFFRNRALEYVRAARALGLTNVQIMWRHILPK